MKTHVNLARAIGATTATFALTMMGVGSAMAAPVEVGNIDPDHDASLTIHKYEGTATGQTNDGKEIVGGATGRTGLDGVTFQVCKVDGLDIHDPADWSDITALNTAVQNDQAHALPPGTTVSGCVTKVTANGGVVTWPDIDQGVYYVTETDAPANVAERVLPFLVTIPLAGTDGEWIYDVHVYPKNATVDIEKEAVEMGALGVGSAVDWTVTNEVPSIQRTFEDYRLFDHLDARLVYDQAASSTVITLGATALDADDYTVTVTTVDGRELVTVKFTPTGLAKLDDAHGSAITWSFKTAVKTIDNGVIENDAIALVNDPDGTYEDGSFSEKVEQTFGALEIVKTVKDTTTPLADAKFQVFGSQDAANACVTAVTAAKGSLPEGCANAIEIARDVTGGALDPVATIFTTDADGKVVIPGLYVGTDQGPSSRPYYVVEIVPPAGFVNANQVYTATITPGSVTTPIELDVENAQTPPGTMPQTGAAVSAALIFGAIALGGGVVALTISNRRKVEGNA